MAALAANNNNIVHMCAYFQVILKASREYAGSTWKHYDAQYRKKAEATLYWSTIQQTAQGRDDLRGQVRQAKRKIRQRTPRQKGLTYATTSTIAGPVT